MARVLILLNACLLASVSCMVIRDPEQFRPAIAPSQENDNSIVYHEENNIMNGKHITAVLNNDADDTDSKESSLGVFRVVMDIVMRQPVSELRAQQNQELSEMTDYTINNAIDGDVRKDDYNTISNTTSTPPTTVRPHPHPHTRCRWCECWEKCRKRRYNWGICLCGKCHCYY